jgi:hypothetical protein
MLALTSAYFTVYWPPSVQVCIFSIPFSCLTWPPGSYQNEVLMAYEVS